MSASDNRIQPRAVYLAALMLAESPRAAECPLRAARFMFIYFCLSPLSSRRIQIIFLACKCKSYVSIERVNRTSGGHLIKCRRFKQQKHFFPLCDATMCLFFPFLIFSPPRPPSADQFTRSSISPAAFIFARVFNKL